MLSKRGRTGCSLVCDRIYALLALVYGGDTFCVSYEESPGSLFWRAGEHFQAWASWMAMDSLKNNLDLSYQDITSCAGDTGSLTLYLRTPYICSSDPARRVSSKIRCQDCMRVKIGMHHGDIVFCTKIPGRGAPYAHTHLVARHSSELVWSNDFDLTLVTGRGIDKFVLSPDALMYHSRNGWDTVNGMENLKEMLGRPDLRMGCTFA